METCLFLIQAALLEHKSMLTRWFLIPGVAMHRIACFASVACGGHRQLVQGVLGVGELAMLGRCIQASEF
jgi:hypothetical protein